MYNWFFSAAFYSYYILSFFYAGKSKKLLFNLHLTCCFLCIQILLFCQSNIRSLLHCVIGWSLYSTNSQLYLTNAQMKIVKFVYSSKMSGT